MLKTVSSKILRKEEIAMKNYTTPEMKIVAFVAEETIALSDAKATNEGSNIFNDAEFGGW